MFDYDILPWSPSYGVFAKVKCLLLKLLPIPETGGGKAIGLNPPGVGWALSRLAVSALALAGQDRSRRQIGPLVGAHTARRLVSAST